jgi:phosphinothricin acetyltransferase
MSGSNRFQFAIRPAGAGDLASINAIYNHYVLHCTCTYQTEPSTAAEREAWFAQHGPGYPVVVAEQDGEVIGWASLSRFHPREAYRHSVEDSVYVRHDVQRRGVGHALLAEMVRQAAELGYHAVLGGISADREASIALHARLGFEKVAHFREVGFKFDRWLDVVWMQRLLPSGPGGTGAG